MAVSSETRRWKSGDLQVKHTDKIEKQKEIIKKKRRVRLQKIPTFRTAKQVFLLFGEMGEYHILAY